MMSQERWQRFLSDLGKRKPNPTGFYEWLVEGQFGVEASDSITLLFADETKLAKAKSYWQKIQNDSAFPFKGKRIHFNLDNPNQIHLESPLQVLKLEAFHTERKRNGELQELSKPVLDAVVEREQTCDRLYQYLTEKTGLLADVCLTVEFPWRVRVGGIRGFRDLLLPVFHPIYGIPYVPSSSLKGLVRAWTRTQQGIQNEQVKHILGYLEGSQAALGAVQILDAFPTAPCLSTDIANPLWTWEGDRVKYGAVPHFLLSMQQPKLLIGLAKTSCGTAGDVELAKEWLEKALTHLGLGSRVSAGYGRTKLPSSSPSDSRLHISSHRFSIWTQGIGDASQRSEFRPVALRGMLRYWFRAIALGLYHPSEVYAKSNEGKAIGLEPQLFGGFSWEGSLKIQVDWQTHPRRREDSPYVYEGTIGLEAKTAEELRVAESLLFFASHVGGIGRGARRPLHRNNGRLRGCFWQLQNYQLSCHQEQWQKFWQELQASFFALHPPRQQIMAIDPGQPNQRYQDVLNQNARLYLLPCPSMIHPQDVQNWNQQGADLNVRGTALNFLYGDERFKGESRNQQGEVIGGNSQVGGNLGTPSYVSIQSNFPAGSLPYQAIVIFGINEQNRKTFVDELSELQGVVQII